MPRLRRPRSPVHRLRQAAAGLLAALALVLALGPADPAPPRGPETVDVVVAAADLPPGRVLASGDLTVAPFLAATTPAGVVSGSGPLLGRVLAGAVRAGEPVTDVRLVGAGLTAALPPGQVAAPVRLADLAVAALVRAGDRVDVLATASGATDAEVVAAGVLVLSAAGPVDGEAGPLAADPAAGLLLLAVDESTAARLAATATTATLTVSLPAPQRPG